MHDVKKTFNYKDLRLRRKYWYIKHLVEKMYNDSNKVVLILNFYQLSSIDTKLFKHYSNWKTVSIQFRKTLRGRRLPILKLPQNSPQNNFLNILTSWKYFHNLTILWGILGIFLKQKFVEWSLNILETLLCDYWNLPKDQHLLLSNHTLLTQKQLFHWEFFKKHFSLKCSLNVPWIPGK